MILTTQNDLLLSKLKEFYREEEHLTKMLEIINGTSKISLRIIDWFVTNFAKKHYTVIESDTSSSLSSTKHRIKVYDEYKLKLKAYSKVRFDPFCRWERISIPLTETSYIQTTIGQLNFFKWALENHIVKYVEDNIAVIEHDMNSRNNNSRSRENKKDHLFVLGNKTRKKREELSTAAAKTVKRESIEVVVTFS